MKKILFLIVSILLIFCSNACSLDNKDLEIHFLDVGKGDSIFFWTPNNKAVLVDAGNLITGYKVVKYLEDKGIDKLDYLIFTHPDLDHIGGAFFIMQMLKIEKVYDNGHNLSLRPGDSDAYEWYKALVRDRKKYTALKKGMSLELDGVTLNILSPDGLSLFSDFNANSLVIMAEYKGIRLLLSGDANILTEARLLKEDISLKADILKVGHHGADDATSESFLKAVLPRLSIISVNKDNVNGRPAADVIDRLKAAGSKVFRTDKDGDIVVIIDNYGKFKIKQGQR